MFLLHFTNSDENKEYLILTDSARSEWDDFARKGFELHTAGEVSAIQGNECQFPNETELHPEN